MIIEKIVKDIKLWWKNYRMSPLEKYLAQSTDIVDLEHRMRAILYKQSNNINYGEK